MARGVRGAILVAGAIVVSVSAASCSTSSDDGAAPTTTVASSGPASTSTTASSAVPTSTAPPSDAPPTTEVGSAALRSDLVIVNSRPRDEPGDLLTPWIEGIGYVRGWGGSRGMVTFPTDAAVPESLRDGPKSRWDVVRQSEIDGLVALQQAHGVQIIYMVNVNDTLQSQVSFIERLRAAGVDLAMLELGNELYLPKFRTGDTTKVGVARAWSAPEYVELLREWGPELRSRFGELPLYGIGASHGTTDSGSDEFRREWNRTIVAARDETPGLLDGITFHQYAGAGSGEAPVEQSSGEEIISDGGFDYLSTFGELPIAVTESGYVTESNSQSDLDRAAQFWEGFRNALKPGDTYGVHLLFQPTDDVKPFPLFDLGGRTPVGDRFASWLTTWAGRP